MRSLIPKLVRRDVLSALKGQGIGRLSYDEMYARADLDICAIETLLANDQFLFGESATAADATVGSTLGSMSANRERTKLSSRVLESQRLTQYIKDVSKSIYPAGS